MKIVERDIETLQVFMLLRGNSGHKYFRGHVFLAGLDHDRRAVCVGRANVGAGVAALLLKTRPDIRLDIFHEMSHVDIAVRIGQRAGDHDFSGFVAQ